MPGISETPGRPAHNRVQVLLNDDDMESLDRHRGDTSVSSFIRALVRRQLGIHPDDDHPFSKGPMVGAYTVQGVETRLYQCKSCSLTKEVGA